MYLITKSFTFDSAHFLRGYVGKCSNMHGHTYRVEVTVKGDKLDKCGMLVDFGYLKELSKSIVETYDHLILNQIHPFTELNPTAENMAQTFFTKISTALNTSNVSVDSVRVWETPTSYAEYRE